MPLYRICLMTADGTLDEESEVDCEHDDAVIDLAGSIDHPHEIHIWESERLVARFPSELVFRSPFGL